MYCPQCGQQQVSGVVRFCSRCGFPLDGVIHLLSNGGMLPVYRGPEESKEMSPRKKGVRQGGILLLSGALVVPILGSSQATLPRRPSSRYSSPLPRSHMFCRWTTEDVVRCAIRRRRAKSIFSRNGQAIHSGAKARSPIWSSMQNALPPPAAQSSSGWRPRPITAELVSPPSVTENTTRLLDKERILRSNSEFAKKLACLSLKTTKRTPVGCHAGCGILIDRIKRQGPITFRDWMEAALYHQSMATTTVPIENDGAGKGTIAPVLSEVGYLRLLLRVISRVSTMKSSDQPLDNRRNRSR